MESVEVKNNFHKHSLVETFRVTLMFYIINMLFAAQSPEPNKKNDSFFLNACANLEKVQVTITIRIRTIC